jgi:hypothetical protein
MRLNLNLDQVLGRNPREVSQLFRSNGIDPDRPYRAQVTLQQIIIEQDSHQGENPAPRI